MYGFDKGRMISTDASGNNIEFRNLQSAQTSFKQNLKELYGRGIDAVYVASGKRTIDIKGEFADMTGASMGTLLSGTKTVGIRKLCDPAPVVAIPAESPHTGSITVPAGGTFNKLLIVYNITNVNIAVPMKRISGGTPANNEFLFTTTTTAGARTYTVTTNFAANDTITINGVTFTAVASSPTGNQFLVGGTIAANIVNLASALSANSTINALYTISSTSTTFTLTETAAGGGSTPTAATVVGTGVVTSGTATTSAAANTFTFSAENAGGNAQIIYDYMVSNVGSTVTLNNSLMGSQPSFQLELYQQLAGVQLCMVLLKCQFAGTDVNMKMEDYTLPSFEAKAFSTAADITGYLYFEDTVAQ